MHHTETEQNRPEQNRMEQNQAELSSAQGRVKRQHRELSHDA